MGIVIDCGGVSTDPRGYIGAHYWHDPGAFRNGFKGFCSVFVTAAFAFGGTELVGLAAAEAADPRKSLPKATKQVFWRITFFYVISLFIVGLIVPSNSDQLLGSSGADTKASPFVLAIKTAGIKGLPSVFNAVITISVISVANSCTFASTRTMQALAASGMGPKFLAKIDKKGRPLACIAIQLLFGLLAFINEAKVGSTVFTWLLSLSGLAYFFVWASICLSHIRFRHGWKVQGHTLDELPYRASFGVIGSYCGFVLNMIALLATFYTSLFVSVARFLRHPSHLKLSIMLISTLKPIHKPPNVQSFFENYLAAPIVIALYIGWKIKTKGAGGFYIRGHQMDLMTGMRAFDLDPLPAEKNNLRNLPMRTLRGLF
jgi:amino acid transporter